MVGATNQVLRLRRLDFSHSRSPTRYGSPYQNLANMFLRSCQWECYPLSILQIQSLTKSSRREETRTPYQPLIPYRFVGFVFSKLLRAIFCSILFGLFSQKTAWKNGRESLELHFGKSKCRAGCGQVVLWRCMSTFIVFVDLFLSVFLSFSILLSHLFFLLPLKPKTYSSKKSKGTKNY